MVISTTIGATCLILFLSPFLGFGDSLPRSDGQGMIIMVIPPCVRLLLVACVIILMMQPRRFPVSFWRARYGHFHHTPGNLLDGCLIGFVVFVCCAIQHITTYKIDIIPRCSSAGGLCRGGWLQCCGNAVRLRLCAFVSCWWVGGYATKKPLRCGCVAATD